MENSEEELESYDSEDADDDIFIPEIRIVDRK